MPATALAGNAALAAVVGIVPTAPTLLLPTAPTLLLLLPVTNGAVLRETDELIGAVDNDVGAAVGASMHSTRVDLQHSAVTQELKQLVSWSAINSQRRNWPAGRIT